MEDLVMVTRTGRIAGLTVVGALALTACGSNDNTTAGGGSTATTSANCASGALSAQGSTFQQNAQLQWAKDFAAKCSGASVEYQGTGSGAGKTAFGNGTADFGGSDSTPKDEEQAAADKRCGTGNKGILTPIVTGGVVLTYNLAGVDKLTLSATTLARIFEGTIKKWDDAAIKADNAGVTLPSVAIVPVHRDDKSGTTKIFSGWLDKNDPTDWKLGVDEKLTWPVGQSGKGSDGVTTAVSQSPGGLTYTELSFAKARDLKVAQIKNASGAAVLPTADSVSAALKSAKVDKSKGDIRITPDYATTEATAYPLAAPSYVLTCDKGNKNTKGTADADLLKAYLTYALTDGTAALDKLGYAPLPDSIATDAKAQVATLS
jgi:phosphate transport system substrate-binding protein